MNPLTLSEIWIYPIKSLGGIKLQNWEVKRKGLKYDRRWMLVDQDGTFMSQRSTPQMALFKTTLEGETLSITFNGDTTSFSVNHPKNSDTIKAQIWDDPVQVIEVSKTLSSWFSEKLDTLCKLVAFPEENKRTVDPDYIQGHDVSLADGYPFLIIGEQTLADLNDRLEDKIEMIRFRPNFIFSGGISFEEDTWKNFQIGKVEFIGVKPCARCAIPTIDPETGKKGIEPTKTLATFRKKNNKIYFGQNLVTLNEGEVRIGDSILIKSKHR